MKKIIILLLCCGVLVSMAGCGGNTASPSTENSPTTVSNTAITETPLVTSVALTEKEIVSIENQEQTSELTSTAPMTMKTPTEEIKSSVATKTSQEKAVSQVVETVTNSTSQHTESQTKAAEPTKEITPEPETPQHEFDIYYWITFAKEYAISIGLSLDSAAIDCWDNPMGANSRCIYLERDIKSRLNLYAKYEEITGVWIWAEPAGNDCYNIYIGYA